MLKSDLKELMVYFGNFFSIFSVGHEVKKLDQSDWYIKQKVENIQSIMFSAYILFPFF